MNAGEDLPERPVKLIKLSLPHLPPSEPKLERPKKFEAYIPLAQATFSIQNGSDVPLAEDAVSLSFKSIAIEPRRLAIIGSLPGRRNATTLCLSPETSQDDRIILQDTQKLESTSKYADKAGFPLCCYHAILRNSANGMFLDVQILWQDTVIIRDKIDPNLIELLRRYLHVNYEQPSKLSEPWQPREFYDNVHVPLKSPENSADIDIECFETPLYAFQRRTVRWMLSREGVVADEKGRVRDLPTSTYSRLPPGFTACDTVDGMRCYVNPTVGVVVTSFRELQQVYGQVVGGLLSDEMGLGKTLSLVATACLHRRPNIDQAYSVGRLYKSGATLIITPPTILEQWKEEIAEHAPSLKVVHYEGLRGCKRTLKDIVSQLAESDIVVTTYNVISREVHYVAEKPDRNMRNRTRQ